MQTSASRTSRGIRYLAIGTSLGGIALFVACLEATQIEAAVSSDATICAPKARSAGAPPHAARYAVAVRHADDPTRENIREIDGKFDPRCDSSAGTAFIGSFTVFPETSDARAHVEIIQLTVDTFGGNPADCNDLDPQGRSQKLPGNCIVVRRRVRFVENRGLRVPMYLDDRCLGVSCAEDQTCFRSKCVSADATCEGSTCLPNHERERGLGGDGAGFDPTKLANLPPGATGVDDAGLITFTDGARVNEAGNLVELDGATVSLDGTLLELDGAPVPLDASVDSTIPPMPDTGPPDALVGDSAVVEAGSPPDGTRVGACSACGNLLCCSTSPDPPFTCRNMCIPVVEEECMRALKGTPNARPCAAPAPPM